MDYRQLTMFGVPADPEYAFNVYHDESGDYSPGAEERWLFHGVLFVPEARQSEIYEALQDARRVVSYYERVHYVGLRGHPTGPKSRCAMGWLNLYAARFSEYCFYHCLAVDTHSGHFEHRRFAEPHHAYNRFAQMAVQGAIAWSLKGLRRVALKFHSDRKRRPKSDNFAVYVPQQTCAKTARKRRKRPGRYPDIRLIHPEVVLVPSDPAAAADMPQECEITQLVDLMTSDIAQALTGTSGQKAKIALADVVARWIEDTRKPPWLQTQELHRRFSLSCFPDEKGRFYNPTLAVVNRNQLPLFDETEEGARCPT